jgi:hypothetical protein
LRSCCQILLLLLLSQWSFAQQEKRQGKEIVPSSSFHAQAQAAKDGAPYSVDVSQKDVRVKFTNGNARDFRVFTIYDDKDHFFWWLADPLFTALPASDQTESFVRRHVIVIDNSELIVFWGSDRPFGLGILASTAKYESEEKAWDDVYKQLDEALFRADLLEHTARGVKTVDLGKLMGVDFTRRKEDRLSAAVHIYWPQIDSVDLVNGEWKIRVENPDKDLAIVLLDKNFDVISASQIEKKTAP